MGEALEAHWYFIEQGAKKNEGETSMLDLSFFVFEAGLNGTRTYLQIVKDRMGNPIHHYGARNLATPLIYARAKQIARELNEADVCAWLSPRAGWELCASGQPKAVPSMSPYVETYDRLTVTQVDEPNRERFGGGYTYIVQTRNMAHVAFHKRTSLNLWLKERGLRLAEELVDADGWDSTTLEMADPDGHFTGSYRIAHYVAPVDEFLKLEGELVWQMDNSDYTRAVITRDLDGIRTVHVLNCNVKDRPVLDWQEGDKFYA